MTLVPKSANVRVMWVTPSKRVGLGVERLSSSGPNKSTLAIDPELDRNLDRRSDGNQRFTHRRQKHRIVSLEYCERRGAPVFGRGHSIDRDGPTDSKRADHRRQERRDVWSQHRVSDREESRLN